MGWGRDEMSHLHLRVKRASHLIGIGLELELAGQQCKQIINASLVDGVRSE